MMSSSDTIAAPATPMGVSAIAMVRVSGPRAAGLAGEIFGATPPPRVATHGDYRDTSGALVDDVVATCFAAPNSYTGEDTLEISCHGNPLIVAKIQADLVARGCRPAEPGEFTQRAFLNGRMELAQAEAVMDLIHARSEAALAAANRQLRGSLGRHMAPLTARLVALLARIEAYVDFPEEDLPPEDTGLVRREIGFLLGETRRLIATGHYGEMLRAGIRVVIVGEPNAGKSSVLNRLLGRNRALISAQPGTTRDYLESEWTIGRHLLRLVDTAGFNDQAGEVERMGIEKSIEQAAKADLFLWVIDGTRPLPSSLPEVVKSRFTATNVVAILNKSDLPGHDLSKGADNVTKTVGVSALTGDGFDKLTEVIESLCEGFAVTVGEEEIAIGARHAASLNVALECLDSASNGIEESRHIELVSSDLRSALAAFGEISGKIGNEKILDQLFVSFCIGK